ncbi:polysaccharide deacetylase [Rhodococcus yananensis]|uniref:polysaccharide deacetylase n=1 Tax=Rhodococcus yananensis TaxID=2879464 RepID=UPI001CF8393D|nr:polysaccharide deacetylase [Rhodococcus yananensis]
MLLRLISILTIVTVVACAPEPIRETPVPIELGAPMPIEPPPTPAPARKESNVEMVRLEPGEKPPQFVLFSFDGVGLSPNWDLFLDTAARVDARFSALMTGLYFLTDENRHHYQGPGRAPGEAAIGFGGTEDGLRTQIEYLNRTWLDGHEMGTHYVGHFCAGSGYHGDRWTVDDWDLELAEFYSLMRDWKANNGIQDAPDLLFGPDEVRGGRTQCLEGRLDQLIPAWHRHGMTWDSSMPADEPGLYWPRTVDGIWEFAIPFVYSPALGRRQTALDYNFWVTFNGARDEPHSAPHARRVVKETYDYMYQRAYHGNRAPLVIANHFNDWNGNSFNPATADFMAEVCDDPDTVCATHSDVVEWLELQDPDVIAQLQALPAVAVDDAY